MHSNALDKVTKQNRLSDYGFDNTIQELNTGKDAVDVEKPSSLLDKKSSAASSGATSTPISGGDREAVSLQTKATTHFNANTSDSLSRTFLDETNAADISLIATDNTNPAGVTLKRSR